MSFIEIVMALSTYTLKKTYWFSLFEKKAFLSTKAFLDKVSQ